MWLVIASVIGFIFGRYDRPKIEVLKMQEKIESLEKEIGYYKDLCQWHVDEKNRIMRENYINE